MHVETITYEDYNGLKRTEDFYFGFTKAELLEGEIAVEGGLSEYAKKIIRTKDRPGLINLFKSLVLKAYGEKSEDGRFFRKNDEIRERFVSSPAYSIIFMKFVDDSNQASKFFNECLPKGMEVRELTKEELAEFGLETDEETHEIIGEA